MAGRNSVCQDLGRAVLLAAGLWTGMLPAGAAEPLRPSSDGAWLQEGGTGLRWARCVEGMHWTGSGCSGEARLMTRDEAIALARARNAAQPSGPGGAAAPLWRLPRVPEMRRLAQLARRPAGAGRTGPAGLDPKLFPAAPAGWHWSVSSQVDTSPVNPYNYGNIAQGRRPDNANSLAFLHGWVVDFESGEARADMPKRSRLPVRWVQVPP